MRHDGAGDRGRAAGRFGIGFVLSDTAFFQLNMMNLADTAVHLTWTGCADLRGAALSVHDPDGGSNSLRWDEADWEGGCSPYHIVYGTMIPPGGDRSLARRVAVGDILDDSLPGARYRLFVTPAFFEGIPSRPVDAGVFTLEQ